MPSRVASKINCLSAYKNLSTNHIKFNKPSIFSTRIAVPFKKTNGNIKVKSWYLDDMSSSRRLLPLRMPFINIRPNLLLSNDKNFDRKIKNGLLKIAIRRFSSRNEFDGYKKDGSIQDTRFEGARIKSFNYKENVKKEAPYASFSEAYTHFRNEGKLCPWKVEENPTYCSDYDIKGMYKKKSKE